MCSIAFGRRGAGKKKPTTVASRGFVSKINSSATRTDGLVGYYYLRENLQRIRHFGGHSKNAARVGQAAFCLKKFQRKKTSGADSRPCRS
jgi:hypothetical protein